MPLTPAQFKSLIKKNHQGIQYIRPDDVCEHLNETEECRLDLYMEKNGSRLIAEGEMCYFAGDIWRFMEEEEVRLLNPDN